MTRRELLRVGFVAYLLRNAFVAKFAGNVIRERLRKAFS